VGAVGWLETAAHVAKVPILTFLGGFAVTAISLATTWASKRPIQRTHPDGSTKERRLAAEDYLVWKDFLVTSVVGVLTLALARGHIGTWQIWGLAVVVGAGFFLPPLVQQFVYRQNGDVRGMREVQLANVAGLCILAVAVVCGIGGG
jgi:hypothetical protein